MGYGEAFAAGAFAAPPPKREKVGLAWRALGGAAARFGGALLLPAALLGVCAMVPPPDFLGEGPNRENPAFFFFGAGAGWTAAPFPLGPLALASLTVGDALAALGAA